MPDYLFFLWDHHSINLGFLTQLQGAAESARRGQEKTRLLATARGAPPLISVFSWAAPSPLKAARKRRATPAIATARETPRRCAFVRRSPASPIAARAPQPKKAWPAAVRAPPRLRRRQKPVRKTLTNPSRAARASPETVCDCATRGRRPRKTATGSVRLPARTRFPTLVTTSADAPLAQVSRAQSQAVGGCGAGSRLPRSTAPWNQRNRAACADWFQAPPPKAAAKAPQAHYSICSQPPARAVAIGAPVRLPASCKVRVPTRIEPPSETSVT